MRSQQDPHFSDLCDRIGRGKITEEDIKHLKTMVRNTDSENFNENFKNGSLSIIVTTTEREISLTLFYAGGGKNAFAPIIGLIAHKPT